MFLMIKTQMKKLITLMVVFFNYTTFAQQMTYVPDDDFEEGLEYLGFGNGTCRLLMTCINVCSYF